MLTLKTIIVRTDSPIRLDRYIRRCFMSLTQGTIEQGIRKGEIKLNGLKSKAKIRVADSDKITFSFRFTQKNSNLNNKTPPKYTTILTDKIFSEYLIYSSDEFIAINKPFGVAVQGGTKINFSINTEINYFNKMLKQDYKLVHRLDKGTSGILLIGKGSNNAFRICEAFKNNLIKKTYIAIVSGIPNKFYGRLSHYIGKDCSGGYESIKELKEGGKKAITDYRVLCSNNKQSIIEFKPITGRMHQIRFHAQSLGCPIIGDKKYGGKRNNRMLLHATEVHLAKSIFGQEILIQSIEPREFNIF